MIKLNKKFIVKEEIKIIKGKNMNKKELINAISVKTEMKKVEVEKVVEGLLETITEELKNGNDISLIGFGTFSTSARAPRVAQVPGTDRKVEVPATTVAKFKVGSKLKAAVAK